MAEEEIEQGVAYLQSKAAALGIKSQISEQDYLLDSEMNDELIPAHKLNKWTYCPRVAWLEWVQGEWLDTADTLDGERVHRRVDRMTKALEEPSQMPTEGQVVARGVILHAPSEGLVAKPDLIEADEYGGLRPVEYKRATLPDTPDRLREPERVQVAAQALALRAHGYNVREGIVYYAGSRTRVKVPITEALVAQVRQSVQDFKEAVFEEKCPPPLVDSPKCVRCALAPVCLPDETAWLTGQLMSEEEEPPIRPILADNADEEAVHISVQGAKLGVRGDTLQVQVKKDVIAKMPIANVRTVSVYGGVQLSSQAISRLMGAGVPVAWHTRSGYLYGLAQPMRAPNLVARRAQFAWAQEEPRCRQVSAAIIANKITNQRTILRRNHPGGIHEKLARMRQLSRAVGEKYDLDQLRGYEGEAAALYFEEFGRLLKAKGELGEFFSWTRRSRRPPRDPVNAVLSFCYALLTTQFTLAIQKVGLDPMLGFLHTARPGRPALALDLMEPFRPIVADSVVLTMINTGQLYPSCFVRMGQAWALSATGRRQVLEAWEQRLSTVVTHPIFGYPIMYSRVFEVQARLFARFLTGEIEAYPPFKVR